MSAIVSDNGGGRAVRDWAECAALADRDLQQRPIRLTSSCDSTSLSGDGGAPEGRTYLLRLLVCYSADT